LACGAQFPLVIKNIMPNFVACFSRQLHGLINDKGQTIAVRCCSQPTEKVRLIYAALKMKEAPFVRKKSVVLKIEPQESARVEKQRDTG